MSYTLQREEPAAVRAEVVDLLARTRDTELPPRRFDWLYLECPDGPAVLWTIRAAEGGLAGYTICVPRRMRVRGHERRGWIGADFSIDPRFRTLGIALKLRRAAKDAIDAGEVDLLYSFPNPQMRMIHRKVGHDALGALERFAAPLSTRRRLPAALQTPFVAPLAVPLANLALRVRAPWWRHRVGGAVAVEDAPAFDARYDALFEAAARQFAVIGVRDARWLRWRYAENPHYRSHAVTVTRGGALRGYALFSESGGVATVRDALWADADAARDVIAALVRSCARRRLDGVSLFLLETSPAAAPFRAMGFQPRGEGAELFTYAAAANDDRPTIVDGQHWLLTVGDRDI